jgi:hypothetical protein
VKVRGLVCRNGNNRAGVGVWKIEGLEVGVVRGRGRGMCGETDCDVGEGLWYRLFFVVILLV